MSRIVSIHQPAYLPWLGYFDRIQKSDIHVFLDTVQFEKNSFINRNQVKTSDGPVWLTIPVHLEGHMTSTIKDTMIPKNAYWKSKHLKTIFFNYKKAPHFEEKYGKLATFYHNDYYGIEGLTSLSEVCWRSLDFWCQQLSLGIPRPIKSSELFVTGTKSELVLNICKHLNADKYLSGPFGRDYLDDDAFRKAGIEVVYHDYQHPTYPQLWGDFIPNMGVVDYWMNSKQFS